MSCGIKDEKGNDICLKIERKHKHRDGRGDRDKEEGKKPLILIGGGTE